ncbi:CUE domain protein [Rasamsonia emersonii CBS 393.64]|uniref:CUE domain protein n=1 Tax=Rasamsonia emersonii (strain ATCC 16479 / CBS 393.64 / IMI 116815) TaxID=1408163 RepID=A0A0F4Z0A2_RASE3|nr:CUE domain protein [Rasamsonia emersonii CBS 393.64]KKA23934.1 CUE domain protein [Rasamsonia emersonii CBS 393.64]
MADEGKIGTPTKTSGGGNSNPESPTTARPLDFDDEPQEIGVTSTETEVPPPKPPRPLTPRQQAENTLKEAFPTVDAAVIKAVLTASDYNIERSFHALLGMTDPKAQEDLPPPKPPRPSYPATSTTQKQLEEDESASARRGEGTWRGSRPRQDDYEEEREYNFFEDDLPVIRENIRKGFLETQSKVNAWVQNFKKKLEGDDDEPRSSGGYGQGYGEGYNRPRRSGDSARRSGDRERYDADPQVLSDDFSALELRDAEAAPPRPTRPLANPNLYRTSASSQERRKVAFQQGPPEEIDNLYDAPESTKRTPSTGGKSSKWQPLSTVEPSPVGDNDPFSLGDSEDEGDFKKKDLGVDETDHAKKATSASDLGSSSKDDSKAGDKAAGK